jgi:hypothetical protein
LSRMSTKGRGGGWIGTAGGDGSEVVHVGAAQWGPGVGARRGAVVGPLKPHGEELSEALADMYARA